MNDYYSSAERAFRESGPMYHLYTFPLETESFYQDSKDRVTVLNLLAICIMDSDCKLLAFSLMSNHFHFIIAGEQARILAFFERFKRLLQNYYRYHGRKVNLGKMTAGLTLIESLRQFQNELAYVIRNSFVVNSEVNVFADLWSSGYLYFNPFLSQEGVPGDQLTVREARTFAQSRSCDSIDSRIYVKDGKAQPWSFVDYKRVMSFYTSARQYVLGVVKQVEAQVETSVRYGERPQLADEELFPIMFRLCREQFKADKPALLEMPDRKRLAVLLKNNYYASNGQLSRLTGLPLSEVNQLFPLTAKTQIK